MSGRALSHLGWLPASQLASLAVSTVGFAVLARTLGPAPFAIFATLIFVYTLLALGLDLSPQGYLLVNGITRSSSKAAWRVATASGAIGAIALGLLCVTILPSGGGPSKTAIGMCLGIAVLTQFLGQVPRAFLITERRYRTAAIIDLASTILSVSCAIALSLIIKDVAILCAQVMAYALLRLLLMFMASRRQIPYTSGDAGVSSIVSYGIRVLPLNVASYASRSLDSGILPMILPAAAAATYARSYQIVVTPVTQAQLSVGSAILQKLAAQKSQGNIDHALQRTWHTLQTTIGLCAAIIGILATPLGYVLFGPNWPMPHVFLSAMTCSLPSLATFMYFSWQMQLTANGKHSIAQLVLSICTPLTVVAAALFAGVQAGTLALVISSLAMPTFAISVYNRILKPTATSTLKPARMQLQLFCAWVVPAAIFTITSISSGFWSHTQW